MSKNESIIKFKATALLLFALMIGVHSLKFFHSHDISNHRFAVTHTIESITTGTGEISFHCSICDYHFTGYINPGFASFEALPLEFVTSFTHYSSYIPFSHIIAFHGRGPPSLLV